MDRERKREQAGGRDLVDSKTGINSSAIYLFPLNIKSSHGRPHTLRANSNYTDVVGKINAQGLQMSKKKTMGKSKDAVWFHVGEDFLIIICLWQKGGK